MREGQKLSPILGLAAGEPRGICQWLIQGLEDRLSESLISTRCRKRISWALLQLDPTNEFARRGLRACLARCRRHARRVRATVELFGKDHDIEPSAALHELAVAIKNGTYAAENCPFASAAADMANPSGTRCADRVQAHRNLGLIR